MEIQLAVLNGSSLSSFKAECCQGKEVVGNARKNSLQSKNLPLTRRYLNANWRV